jgi:PhoPQ-activated pathogenicity-related protein
MRISRILNSRSLVAMAVLSLLGTASPAVAGLDEYVKKVDPTYKWSLEKTEPSDAGTIYSITLTSQTWQGIPWVHHVRIYEPAEMKYPEASLLFITGGSTTSQVKPEDTLTGFGLAKLCGSRVVVLPQVPNQPLFGGKTEDTLIAETFVRYLDTKDENWPLLFPMVKSAVKAMDMVQEWQKKEGKPVSEKFVVTGASKRGWTTWLTGASDSRVIAIAPMVIDTLNMKEQRVHALEVWGKYSEQINDYSERGLTEKFDDPTGSKLWKMVDPFSYLDRLKMPKLLINGTNDRYWTLDALNIYWSDIKGQKSVVYLPNAGHNLAVNRDYALNGIGALFRSTVSKQPWPQLTWQLDDSKPDTVGLSIASAPVPKGIKYWVAKSETRDFRDSVWEPTTLKNNTSTVEIEVPRPAKGFIAILGDVTYEMDGIPFHLSTQILQTGAKPKK